MNKSEDTKGDLISKLDYPKILFVHNSLTFYRIPFFRLLNKNFSIQFVFTYLKASEVFYNIKSEETLDSVKDLNMKICKPYFHDLIHAFPEGIPFGLLKHLFLGDYDIIIDNLQSTKIFMSLFASKVRKKPLIIWSEGWDFSNSSYFSKVKLSITHFLLSKSDAIIVPGSKHLGSLNDLGIAPDKIFIMPNVNIIENSEISNQDIAKLKSKYKLFDKKVILYVGRLVRRKGVHYLINAFSLLKKDHKNVILFIVGKGPCENYLKKLASDLSVSDSVVFFDFVDNKDLPLFYSLSNVCVVPSITYVMKEPWGFVLNEAMQFGNPVIATTSVGSAYDLIDNGKNGFMIPERDKISLYKHMKIIIEDKELEREMGENSKNMIRDKFQYDNMLNAFNSAVDYINNIKRD